MRSEYTAIVKQQGDWWIGWIGGVHGINCQERSYQELLESLRITLQEAIEFNRKDAIASAGFAAWLRVRNEWLPLISCGK